MARRKISEGSDFTTVVDVAGGKGAVAAALLRRGASRKATVIDPVGLDRNHAGEEQASVDDAFSDAVQLLKEPFAYPPSSKQNNYWQKPRASSRCTPTRRRSRPSAPRLRWVCPLPSCLVVFLPRSSPSPPVLEVRPGPSQKGPVQRLGHFL